MTEKDGPLQILLVEDNPIDVLMTREALKTWEIQNTLHVVEDGQEAVNFLYRRGIYDQAERPDLILLDLNLPRKSGIEVLSEIRQDSDLSNITVVVVTTSAKESDLEMCNELGAKRCIAKPLEFEEYVRELCSIQEFWLSSFG
jgi:two-component system, chemotaxis family, response regulator Rcp1